MESKYLKNNSCLKAFFFQYIDPFSSKIEIILNINVHLHVYQRDHKAFIKGNKRKLFDYKIMYFLTAINI